MLYIPLILQAAELGSAGHASPPAWSLPIVEVMGAARQERGRRKQEKRHRGERWNHSSRQEQEEKVKGG